MVKFNFDKDFQQEVLALVFQKWDFLVSASELIKPEYFEDKVHGWYYSSIMAYYHEFNQKPTPLVLKNELLKAAKRKSIKKEEVKTYLDVYSTLSEKIISEDYIRREVVRFCKMQSTKKALLEVSEMLHSEDLDVWDNIGIKLTSALRVGDNAADMGIRYFEEVDERVRLRSLGDDKLRIPTGIQDLDNIIGGGLKEEQMCLWMAGTGVGKSLALAQVGRRASVNGYNVVYYTLELSDDDIAERFDSLLSRVPIMHIDQHPDDVVKRVKNWGKMYGNNLVIKQYPPGQASVNTIKSHLTMLHNNGFKPDLIIVDYLDLLKSTSAYTDEYAALGSIATDLRGLAVEFKVPLHSATQVNRAGMQSDVVELAHVSDSLKKLFVADIVIPICRNRDEKASNRARLFTAKNRNGPEGIEVPINTDYARMAFYAPSAPDQPVANEVDEEVVVRRRPIRQIQKVDFPVAEA